MSDHLKAFSKSVTEFENITLTNKVLLGGWILTASKVFRRNKNVHGKNLPGRFENCVLKECKIKKQSIYKFKNLYKLMWIAPKLLNCQFNMTYFVKNRDILLNHFQQNEEQSPWEHNVNCIFETCNSYFTEHIMSSWSCVK